MKRLRQKRCKGIERGPMTRSGYALALDRKTRPEKVKLPPPQADTPTKPYLAAVVAACLQALLANMHALIAAGQAMNPSYMDSPYMMNRRVISTRAAFFA